MDWAAAAAADTFDVAASALPALPIRTSRIHPRALKKHAFGNDELGNKCVKAATLDQAAFVCSMTDYASGWIKLDPSQCCAHIRYTYRLAKLRRLGLGRCV